VTYFGVYKGYLSACGKISTLSDHSTALFLRTYSIYPLYGTGEIDTSALLLSILLIYTVVH
jgi:hypothetical protein